MTKREALELVNVLAAAYPRQVLEKPTIDLYTLYLQDLDYRVTQRVIANHIRNEKWFPTIAEIREACVEMVHEIPSTEQAMEIIREAVRRNDFQSISQNDLMRQAIATVGFEKIGYSEYAEPLYRQIKEAYENLRKREIKQLQSTPAVGMLATPQPKALEA